MRVARLPRRGFLGETGHRWLALPPLPLLSLSLLAAFLVQVGVDHRIEVELEAYIHIHAQPSVCEQPSGSAYGHTVSMHFMVHVHSIRGTGLADREQPRLHRRCDRGKALGVGQQHAHL